MNESPPHVGSHVPVLVVLFLGAVSLILSVGILVLLDRHITPDAALYTLAGGAVGALGSLLAKTSPDPGHRPADTPAGTDADPVKVEAPAGGTVDVTPQIEEG